MENSKFIIGKIYQFTNTDGGLDAETWMVLDRTTTKLYIENTETLQKLVLGIEEIDFSEVAKLGMIDDDQMLESKNIIQHTKTSITITDSQIHLMVVNYDTKKREDVKIPIDPQNANHHLVIDEHINLIKERLLTMKYLTL